MIPHIYSLAVSFILADRQKKEGHRAVIKAQTAVRGGVRREGGRKEGRRSVSWRDRAGRICRRRRRRRRRRGNTGVACSKQRLCPLGRGYVHASVKQRGSKSWLVILWCGEELTHQCAAPTHRQTHVHLCVCANPNVIILMHTTHGNADMQLHAHLEFSSQVAVWIQVIKYSLRVATYIETNPWGTLQYVLYVRRSLSFSFSGSFLSAKPVLLTAFPQPDASSIYLSSPFPSPSLFSCPSLPLGTVWLVRAVIELPLFDQGGNRNCTLLTQLCRYVCVCVCKHIFQEGTLIVYSYVYNVWLPAVCVSLITVYISLQYPGVSVWSISKHDIRLYVEEVPLFIAPYEYKLPPCVLKGSDL